MWIILGRILKAENISIFGTRNSVRRSSKAWMTKPRGECFSLHRNKCFLVALGNGLGGGKRFIHPFSIFISLWLCVACTNFWQPWSQTHKMFSKQDFCVCCLWPDEALMAEKFKGSRCWTLPLWFFHHIDTNISCQLEIMQNNSFWMIGINTFQTSAWRIKTEDDDNLKVRGARTAKQLACMCRPEKKGACFVILVATL